MIKTKEDFTWKRTFSAIKEVIVKAGAPVEWNAKNKCFYVIPSHFGGIFEHDAKYYGCRVVVSNVVVDSIEELKSLWKVLDVPEALIEKGYKYVIQFEEDGKEFGSPLAFKEESHISSFMWENQKMKMKWLHSNPF